MVQIVSFRTRHSSPVSHSMRILKIMNPNARSRDIEQAFHEKHKTNRIINNRLRFNVPGPSISPCPAAPLLSSISLPGEEIVLVVDGLW